MKKENENETQIAFIWMVTDSSAPSKLIWSCAPEIFNSTSKNLHLVTQVLPARNKLWHLFEVFLNHDSPLSQVIAPRVQHQYHESSK